MDEAYCPGCNAALGSLQGEVGISCWKCGLAFGETASTKPIVRAKQRFYRHTAGRFVAALVAPGLLDGVVLIGYPRIPVRMPLLGAFAIIPAFGLALFHAGCIAYLLECLLQTNRSFAWLIYSFLLAMLAVFDTLLLFGAAGMLSR